MKIAHYLPLGRIVGKIDNDFNISESDWIPRVAAWVIDALSQMKVLPMERKRRLLEVSERIAQFPCTLNAEGIRVFEKCGCEIPRLRGGKIEGLDGNLKTTDAPDEIAIIDTTNKSGVNFMQVGRVVDSKGRNFVLDGDNIELNFDTDSIVVESLEVATYHDDYYDCDVPYIYDEGTLLEALCWYCMFKYLSRGSKHPVYDLKSNSPTTNPYLQWSYFRPRAMAAVKIKLNEDEGWRNFFYNSTFTPRG